jgi:hypothetical protein
MMSIGMVMVASIDPVVRNPGLSRNVKPRDVGQIQRAQPQGGLSAKDSEESGAKPTTCH